MPNVSAMFVLCLCALWPAVVVVCCGGLWGVVLVSQSGIRCWVLFSVGLFNGEFDPGSGRTLAACLTHASRTMIPSLLGGLVANG